MNTSHWQETGAHHRKRSLGKLNPGEKEILISYDMGWEQNGVCATYKYSLTTSGSDRDRSKLICFSLSIRFHLLALVFLLAYLKFDISNTLSAKYLLATALVTSRPGSLAESGHLKMIGLSQRKQGRSMWLVKIGVKMQRREGGSYQPITASGDRRLPLLGILPSLPAASLRRSID